MTDLGDSKDDAESLLEQLKEFNTKSMVSTKVLELLLKEKLFEYYFSTLKIYFIWSSNQLNTFENLRFHPVTNTLS